MAQNTGSTQARTKLPQILPLIKITENVESNTILEVTDDNGVIQIMINIKCIVKVVDTIFPLSSPFESH